MLELGTALAVNGREPKVPEGTLVYAVGDVHGRADLLEKMHAAILKDAVGVPAERKVVVYLGDYVDRGPASKKVVDLLLERPLHGFERVHLMGNHEAFLIEFLNDLEAGPGWFFNGGARPAPPLRGRVRGGGPARLPGALSRAGGGC